MIIVRVFRNESAQPTGFSCRGHSEQGPAGTDIVCAAVTALATAAINGITDLLDLHPDIIYSEGNIQCILDPEEVMSKEQREGASLLINTFEMTVRSIVDEYEKQGETYILLAGHNLEVQDYVED